MAAKDQQKRIVLFTSEKGGAGKSFAACALVDYGRSNRIKLAAYDADGGVGALVQMYGTRNKDRELVTQQDPLWGVGYYNLRNDDERAMLVNSADGTPLVIHDLAGGGLADLMRIQDSGAGLTRLLRAFHSLGYRITLVHLLTHDDSATGSIATYLDEIEKAGEIGTIVDHVVMKNRLYGSKDDDFPFWIGFTDPLGQRQGGATRARMKDLGGIEIELPLLDRKTAAKIKAFNIPFRDAETSRFLTISEQQHVRNFRLDFADAIRSAGPILGLAPAQKEAAA